MTNRWLLSVLILAFALRCIFAVGFHGNFDQESYEIVASIVRAGGNVYTETERYNYSPVWFLLLGGLSVTSEALSLPFHTAVRGFLSLIDCINIVLIGLLIEYVRKDSRRKAVLLYAFNPAVILIVGYHGPLETLALMPFLFGLLLYKRSTAPIWVWLCFGAAILIKHNLAFAVLPALVIGYGPVRALGVTIAIGVAFLLSFVPFWSDGESGIVHNVFQYRSTIGWYGLTMVLPQTFVSFLMLGSMAIASLLLRRREIVLGSALCFLIWLIMTPGLGLQYFLPLLALWAVCGETKWPMRLLSGMLTLLYVAGIVLTDDRSVWALHVVSGPFLWIVLLVWLLKSRTIDFHSFAHTAFIPAKQQ